MDPNVTYYNLRCQKNMAHILACKQKLRNIGRENVRSRESLSGTRPDHGISIPKNYLVKTSSRETLLRVKDYEKQYNVLGSKQESRRVKTRTHHKRNQHSLSLRLKEIKTETKQHQKRNNLTPLRKHKNIESAMKII